VTGTAIASFDRVRHLLVAAMGVLIGLSIAVAAVPSPFTRASAAVTCAQTARLDPSPPVRPDLRAEAQAGPVGTVVALEESRGVWIVPVVLNGAQAARFLLDTGSSVTLLSPRIAARLPGGLPSRDTVELQTLTGLTAGPAGRLASLRIGDADLQDVPVVLHDPGPGIDGILGNTVLARYKLTLDSHRKLLHLATAR
jgi:predicted aspartyl protease